MPALRFAIEAAAGQAGFTVKLAHQAAAGEAFKPVRAATITLPLDLSLDAPLDDPAQPGQPLTAAAVIALAAQAPVPPAVGHFMHRLLLRGKLADEVRRLGGENLPWLLDIGPAAALAPLRRLPWERLRNEDTGQFAALRPGAPLARWYHAPAQAAAAADDWPLRVLVIVGVAPGAGAGAAQRVGAEDEMIALEQLFASAELRQEVEYDVLETPSRQAVVEACERVRPHVLHVIAHAQAGAAGAELLLWQPPDGTRPALNDPWPAADILNQFQALRPAPRLVLLNACNSNTPGDSMASLTQAFLQAGAVAAVGMQGEIAGDLARAFAVALYGAACKPGGVDLDAAVLEARRKMSGARVGAKLEDDADWSFPVLTRSVAADAVLPRLPQRPGRTTVERFVSRLAERRAAHEAIRCCTQPTQGQSQHLLLVVGAKLSGKSYLSEWTAQACRRAGMAVADVAYDPEHKVDWLDALRWLRDGMRQGVNQPSKTARDWPLPAGAFAGFNTGLNRRLRGQANFDPPPVGPVADEGLALAASTDHAETLIEDTLAAFRDALGVAAKPGGLLIKLDQLDGVDRHSLAGPLMDGLIRPIARGHVAGVRLLLVLDQALWELHRAEFDRIELRPPVVRVPYFRQGEFDRVARQLCHQWSSRLWGQPGLIEMLRLMLPGQQEPPEWSAQLLADLSQVLRVFAAKQGEPV